MSQQPPAQPKESLGTQFVNGAKHEAIGTAMVAAAGAAIMAGVGVFKKMPLAKLPGMALGGAALGAFAGLGMGGMVYKETFGRHTTKLQNDRAAAPAADQSAKR